MRKSTLRGTGIGGESVKCWREKAVKNRKLFERSEFFLFQLLSEQHSERIRALDLASIFIFLSACYLLRGFA